MKKSIVLKTVGLCLFLSSSIMAAIPKQMSYQGILSDSTGMAINNDTVSVEFRIFETPVGGTSKWVETQDVVTDDEGRFNVLLGLFTPIEDTVFRETERYLSVNVESNGAIIPRTKLVSVGFANRVSTVDGASGGTISGNTGIQSDLTISGDVGIGTTSPVQQLHVAGNGYFTGAVGIGTSSPQSELHVESSDPNSTNIRIYNTSTGDPTISFLTDGVFQYTLGVDDDESDKLQISGGSTLNSSERLTLTTTGDVGIGTTSPSAKLHVLGATGDEVMRLQAPPATASPFISLWYNTFEGARIQTVNDVSDGGSLRFFTAAPPFGSVFERMRVSSSGNVGIGTTSPTKKLEVAGSIKVGTTDTVFTSNLSSNSPLRFDAPTGTNRMFIDDVTGNVGIGTSIPEQKLAVRAGSVAPGQTAISVSADLSAGDQFSSQIHILTNNSSAPARLAFSNTTSAGQPNPGTQIAVIEGQYYSDQQRGYLAFQTRAIGPAAMLERVRIDSSGYVGIGTPTPAHPLHMGSGAHCTAGGTWTNGSSRDYKFDIKPLQDEEYSEILEKLEDLDVVRFKFKADPKREHIGMIAEDVPAEMASDDRKGIPTSDAIAFLVAAVKAQQEKIEKLEKRLKDVEQK